MSKIPYIIVTPDYRNTNAGVRVLFKFCYLLNKKGYESYVNSPINNCPWKVETLYNETEKTYKLIQNGAIVVYPEIYGFNFLCSSRPVGYICNPQKDLPYLNNFYYHDFFGRNKNLLTIDVIEKDLFNQNEKQERIYNTVWIGKGNGEELNKLKLDNVKIISYSEPKTRKEIADLFKKSKAFYSFDGITALNSESRLCGCPCYFIPNKFHSREYAEVNTWKIFKSGFARDLSDKEIKFANETLKDFEKEYNEVYNDKRENEHLDNFIKITQDM